MAGSDFDERGAREGSERSGQVYHRLDSLMLSGEGTMRWAIAWFFLPRRASHNCITATLPVQIHYSWKMMAPVPSIPQFHQSKAVQVSFWGAKVNTRRKSVCASMCTHVLPKSILASNVQVVLCFQCGRINRALNVAANDKNILQATETLAATVGLV